MVLFKKIEINLINTILNIQTMSLLSPIIYIDLLKQSPYKTTILLSLIHKQRTYFSKKYSKSNRITLNKYDSNELFVVCEKDNIKIIKYIGEKIVTNNCFIFRCAGLNHIRIVRYCLNNGCNIDYESERCICEGSKSYHIDYTLLSYSSKENCLKLVIYLLKKGANIHVYGEYALELSSQFRHIEIVKVLLKNGANVRHYNNYALRWSAKYGHTEVVKLLLNEGADVHTDNDDALRRAAFRGHTEIVRLLLENG